MSILRQISGKVASGRTTAAIAVERINARQQGVAQIGYIGAHGYQNLGDDAMFEAAQKLFSGDTLVTLHEPWHERRLAPLGLAGNRYCRTAVLGGGTLINPFAAHRVRDCLRMGLSLSTLGTGVGSCGFRQSHRVNIDEWKPLLADFQKLGVRGPRSKEALEAIGLSNVEIIGDLALSLARDECSPLSDPPSFGINLACPDKSVPEEAVHWGPEYSRLQELEHILKEFVRAGWRPVPVAMNASDLIPLKELMERITSEQFPIPVAGTAEAFYHLTSSCSFVIAGRLHAAILACCMGVPTLMLGYRDKCLDFMESMQLTEWCVSLQAARPGTIADKVQSLEETAPRLRAEILPRAQYWKRAIEAYARNIAVTG